MPGEGRKVIRTCLGCRGSFEQDLLVRYVLSPDGDVLVDYRKRLPGRGGYTCLSRECIVTAVKKRQFDRGLRGDKTPNAEQLIESLAGQIRERILGLIGMARKSGNLISGSGMVLDTLATPGRLAMVIMSEDVSDGIGTKVSGKAAATGVECYRMFSKDLLGHLLGKGERSVVGIAVCPLAEAIRTELLRYKDIVGES